MAVRETIPTENVKMEDIRDTLNAYGGKVTDDLTTFFSDTNGVNLNAKYKPVRLDENFPDYGTYWKSDNCGLSAKSVTHVSQLAGVIDGNLNGWTYNKPRGGTYNEPWRLGDFRGYDPNAAPIVAELLVPSKIQKGTLLTIDASVAQGGGSSVTVADLMLSGKSAGEYYFGAYIAGTGSNCVKTAASPLSNYSASVTFDTSNFGSNTDHKVYVALFPAAVTTQSQTLVTSTYYTVPYTPVKMVRVVDYQVTGPFLGGEAAVTAGTNVRYTVQVTQGSQGTRISGIIVKFRMAGKRYSDALVNGVESQVLLNVTGTIGPGFNFTYTGDAAINQSLINTGEVYMFIKLEYGTSTLVTEDDYPIQVALLQDDY